VLPKEQVTEQIQVINNSARSIVLTVSTPSQISVESTEGFFPNLGDNVGSSSAREFYLESWQKIEIGFRIQQSDE
jgi:hypothetical protein